MTEEPRDQQKMVDEYVAKLKTKLPEMEHGALDSRLEELLNDPSADDNDVVAILELEFDPHHKG